MPLEEKRHGAVNASGDGVNHRGEGRYKAQLTQKAEHRVSAKHNWREKGDISKLMR